MRFGRLDLRVGRQIFAWGRADGVNPTDNLTGEDLTLLAPDDDDRRLGTTAVRASYYLGDVSVSALWLPEFRGHRFPLPAPPPGLDFVRDVREWPGDQWAVRVEQTGRAVDWSASYFDGRDLFPDLSIDVGSRTGGAQPARGAPGIRLSHHRVRVAGADMAANVGRFALRAEGAYVDTEDSTGNDPFTKNPFVFLVLGGDRTFREYLNLNVQYLYRFVVDYQPAPAPMPVDSSRGISARDGRLAAGGPQQPGEARAARHVVSRGAQMASRNARSGVRRRRVLRTARPRYPPEDFLRPDRPLESARRRRGLPRRVVIGLRTAASQHGGLPRSTLELLIAAGRGKSRDLRSSRDRHIVKWLCNHHRLST